MFDIGMTPENFNPRVLYIMKRKFTDQSHVEYHAHDFVSMIYVLSGSCTYNIDGTHYRVKKGDLVVCNPGVYHGKIIDSGEEIIEFHVGISNICIRNLGKDALIGYNECPVHNLSKYELDFLKCCNEIVIEQEKDEPGCELILKALVMKLVAIFLKSVYTSESPLRDSILSFESYDRINVVNTIVSYINENYMKDISLDKISRNMYLSPVYISKVFKDETGDSPINYLIKTRLAKAKELLAEGRLTIKAVAENVGYHDAYHFSKLFKKYYGYPPSKHKAV